MWKQVQSLVITFLCLAIAPVWAQTDIISDPFIQEAISSDNWSPRTAEGERGKYYPNIFWSRGHVIEQTGNVSLHSIHSQIQGNFKTQNANISGDYTYVVDLDRHHPHEDHGPFDLKVNNSASDRQENPDGTLSSYELKWTGTFIHPANAYDPPEGGGFPTPDHRGAIDIASFNITGTAVGVYPLSQRDIQVRDVAKNQNQSQDTKYNFQTGCNYSVCSDNFVASQVNPYEGMTPREVIYYDYLIEDGSISGYTKAIGFSFADTTVQAVVGSITGIPKALGEAQYFVVSYYRVGGIPLISIPSIEEFSQNLKESGSNVTQIAQRKLTEFSRGVYNPNASAYHRIANNFGEFLSPAGFLGKFNKVVRPTSKASELYVLKKKGGRKQISYKNGVEVPYGTKGSVRIDVVTNLGQAIEVKNYDLSRPGGKDSLIRSISTQINKRVKHLPSGMEQAVQIDVRGQKIKSNILKQIQQKIYEKTNKILELKDINFIK